MGDGARKDSSVLKPYYDEDGITIYHGDCRDILPTLDPVDLVLTDPPYNVGYEYGEGTNDHRDRTEYFEWCKQWFGLLRRRARVVALTPGTKNIGSWYQIEDPRCLMCWHKPAAMGRSAVGFCNWEPVCVWSDVALSRQGDNLGTDVVTAPIKTMDGISHPCPKPIAWARGFIKRLTRSGPVLDPFMGSGTVLIAAKDMGLQAIGIEIEERYCEIAAKRLAQGVFDFSGENACLQV